MIRGKKINLRLMRESDLDAYIELHQDLELRGEYFPLNLHSGVEMRKKYSETGYWTDGIGALMIVDPKDDRVLGTIHVMKTSHYFDGVELGYILFDRASRGKGIMSEAVEMTTDYVFKARNISRVQIMSEPGNIGSLRVAEKCGFKREGLIRGAFLSLGKACDLVCFGMTRDDWNELQQVRGVSAQIESLG